MSILTGKNVLDTGKIQHHDQGRCCKSFTMMFLQMWDAASSKSKNEENYEQYLVPADYKLPEDIRQMALSCLMQTVP